MMMVAFRGTFNSKCPSKSEITPFVVPSTTIEAPIIGSPFSSRIVPSIRSSCCCTMATDIASADPDDAKIGTAHMSVQPIPKYFR